jgi:hypothetical protein
MTIPHLRDGTTSIFDEHGTDIYTRTWYYATLANQFIEHHLATTSSTIQPLPIDKLSLRFFGVKPLDEELSLFVNHKLRLDTTVNSSVLSQYKRYIKPLLTAYVNATEEERKYVIVTAGKGSDIDTTTNMSKFTVGTKVASGNSPRHIFITKTVGEEPDHSDNMGAFGDHFQYIMRSDSPFTDLTGFDIHASKVERVWPNVHALVENETPETKKYISFVHNLLLTFIHDAHARALAQD